MKKIRIDLNKRSYEILVGYKILNRLGEILKKLDIGADALVVTNPTIRALHGGGLQSALGRSGFSIRFELVPDSETSKSQKVCAQLLERIAIYDVRKRLFIVALGGGVIGDLAGYAAAVYKRGVSYIQVPTTLLSQVDSAIGGKVGIDLVCGKNLVGAFYQPRLVLSDLSFLQTLSLRAIRAGLAEVVKYGVIKDGALFGYLERNYSKILRLSVASLERIISASSRIKAEVVKSDEKEQRGLRTILNFGHTIGHAIEAASGYSQTYTHGEAVAIGMVCACEISQRLGFVKKPAVERIERLLSKIGLPTRIKGDLKLSDIMEAQSHDKKFIHGKNRFVLPIAIGKVKVVEDIPIKAVEEVIKGRLGH